MNLTVAQIAHGLARLEGRQRPNRDDWTLAKAAHPALLAVEPTAEDVELADELLGELAGGARRG